MSDKLTKGEQKALAIVYGQLANSSRRTFACVPNGVQWRTMENLCHKGLLRYESGPYGHDRFYLTDEGKEVGSKLVELV